MLSNLKIQVDSSELVFCLPLAVFLLESCFFLDYWAYVADSGASLYARDENLTPKSFHGDNF